MMIFVVKVMMFFVSIGLLCFGLFGLCGSRANASEVIALVAGIKALCPVLLLMGGRVWVGVGEGMGIGCYCYCSCNMVMLIFCNL